MATNTVLQLNDLAILKKINKKYTQSGLSFGWKSNIEKTTDYGHWNNLIIPGSKKEVFDMAKTPFIDKHREIQFIWEKIKSLTDNKSLMRCYINAYTYGTDAYAHIDDPWYHKLYGDNVKSETVIIYLNEKWHIDWAGETVIFKDNDIEQSFMPKFGRLVLFDSKKLHAARPLSRTCPSLRTVLVFKTGDLSVFSKNIEFLLPLTKNIKHGNKSFFEHLFNTSVILENLEVNNFVRCAGLFHAIYSTEFFKHDINVSRDTIQGLIGNYSENLVYEFCNLKNRYNTLLNNTKNYDSALLKDLLLIEAANLKEQNENGIYDIQLQTIGDKIGINFV